MEERLNHFHRTFLQRIEKRAAVLLRQNLVGRRLPRAQGRVERQLPDFHDGQGFQILSAQKARRHSATRAVLKLPAAV
jgi:hypothetical protein